MGLLHQKHEDRYLSPGARCLVGRSRACSMVVPDPTVSGEHAVVFYGLNGRWAVRDLGSRNGTWVGQTRVGSGDAVELPRGVELRFGVRAAPWVLVDDGPPAHCAVGEDRTVRQSLDGVLVLPDEEEPSVWVVPSGRDFVVEHADGRVEPVIDGQVFDAGGQRWRVLVPRGQVGEPLPATIGPSLGPSVADLRLELKVSHDGAYVQVTLVHGLERIEVPPRACHHLVLALARARLSDRSRGLAEADCGWVHPEDLHELLDASPQKLHVDVLRCRRQLGGLGVHDADDLFERRSTTREIRIGIADLVVRDLGARTQRP